MGWEDGRVRRENGMRVRRENGMRVRRENGMGKWEGEEVGWGDGRMRRENGMGREGEGNWCVMLSVCIQVGSSL